jgi:phenylalanyl-tRNA synthetase, alpha subunit
MEQLDGIKAQLISIINSSDDPRAVFKSSLFKDLYKKIPQIVESDRAEYGQAVNRVRQELEVVVKKLEDEKDDAMIEALDVTAPFGINSGKIELMSAENGSRHPLTRELERVAEIYQSMGFEAVESRQLDDDYHMFKSLNFPDDHPARDSYDTFRTAEGFIPPAHTSVMQNRILRTNKKRLEDGENIAAVSYGRVFRNEDLDATHEHTFYQCEGVFVSKDATLGQMLGVLKQFFETYYGQKLKIKTQPGYFPFTEPSLEFAIEKPASLGGKGGDWLEMLGCGMIHPNVLKEAGIDPEVYKGFAWGGGIERLVMLKYGIEDIRWFESGKLQFLKGF